MVLNYWSDLQAYRTDTFTGYVPSPNNELGLLLFGWNKASYFNLETVSGGDTGGGGGGAVPPWVWVAVVGGVPLAALVVWLSRRKTSEDEA